MRVRYKIRYFVLDIARARADRLGTRARFYDLSMARLRYARYLTDRPLESR